MSAEEARYAALRTFGGVEQVKEECREAWGVRYGLRQLRRNPGFTAVAVLTLALGIGANTAIFSLINAVLLRPLPFRTPDRLLQLWETEPALGGYPFAGPDYLDWQAENHTLQASSLYTWQQSFNASGAGEPEEVGVVATEANFFSVLGVASVLGRTFARGEDRAGADHVAVLSFGFWRRHFAGRKDAIGKPLELNREKYTVVGVMPVWFHSVGTADVWVPLDMTAKALGQRGNHNYLAIGRLKSGVSVTRAQSELEAIAKRLEKLYPDSNQNVGAVVVPLQEQLVGDSRPELLLMMAVVEVVLLVACANVANLLLARATGRHREIAVRCALGAGRGRLVRQLLTESALLSVLGGSAGAALAWTCVHALGAAQSLPIPRSNAVSVDGTVLLFTLGVSVLAGILFGFAPAWQNSYVRLSEDLKSGAQTAFSPTSKRHLLGDALVVGEIAIALAVLIASGLLLRSFARLREVRVGVQPEGVLTARIVLPPKKYATPQQIGFFYQQLLSRLTGAPGVVAAVSSELPIEGGNNGYVTIPSKPRATLEKFLVEWNYITPNYFRVLGIPFFEGRNFAELDAQNSTENMAKVDAMFESGKMQAVSGVEFPAIINEKMAKTFWPGEGALGRVFKLGGLVPVKVIGIVGDVKEWGIRGPVAPQAYFPDTATFDNPGRPMIVTLKGQGDPGTLVSTLRSEVRALDGSLAIFRVRTMKEIFSEAIGDTRFQTLLLAFFALLALTLTAVGIYGVIAYTVTQRTHEIGIRMAVGAERGDVLRLVLGQGLRLALIGVGIGIIGALALTRFLSSLLYGVKPTDPLTFITVSLILIGVALLACYIPARRATKVDPMVALRYE